MTAVKKESIDEAGKTKVGFCLECSGRPHSQDKIHGSGKRVMNWSKKSSGWRCTVCGRINS